MRGNRRGTDHKVELSFVIPVYNGSATIEALVARILRVFAAHTIEIVLVNDGSDDASERVCAALADANPGTVAFIQLARNFGEHNAVLAGLNHAQGDYVAVLDDDGQNPPEEVLRMFHEIMTRNYDVVYGRYRVKRHAWFRNLGSWFNNRMANVMLKKPPHVYLSSFKVMNRFLADEVTKYRGAFPYIDGLIYRTTRNIGQIDVEHRERDAGKSNYTFRKLVMLWLNMFLNFSILPLRVAAITGLVTALSSVVMIVIIWIDKFCWQDNPKPGIPTVLCTIVFFGGMNLLLGGMLGEYLGRLYLDQTGTPQYVIRYVKRSRRDELCGPEELTSSRRVRRLGSSTAETPANGIQIVAPHCDERIANLKDRGSESSEVAANE